jgi:hypothetical protein
MDFTLFKEIKGKLDRKRLKLVDLVEENKTIYIASHNKKEDVVFYKGTVYNPETTETRVFYVPLTFTFWDELNNLLYTGWESSYIEVILRIYDEELEKLMDAKETLFQLGYDLEEYLMDNSDSGVNEVSKTIMVESGILTELLTIVENVQTKEQYEEQVIKLALKYGLDVSFSNEDDSFNLGDLKDSRTPSGVLEVFTNYMMYKIKDKVTQKQGSFINHLVRSMDVIYNTYHIEQKTNLLSPYQLVIPYSKEAIDELMVKLENINNQYMLAKEEILSI